MNADNFSANVLGSVVCVFCYQFEAKSLHLPFGIVLIRQQSLYGVISDDADQMVSFVLMLMNVKIAKVSIRLCVCMYIKR